MRRARVSRGGEAEFYDAVTEYRWPIGTGLGTPRQATARLRRLVAANFGSRDGGSVKSCGLAGH